LKQGWYNMTDPGQNPGQAPADDDQNPAPHDQNPVQPEDGQEPAPDPKPDDFDPDRALRTIRNLRQREKDLEAKVKAFEDSQKTEAQRLADQKAEAEKQAAEAKAEAAKLRLQVAASSLGAKNPETVAKLADLEAYDGDAQAAVEALKGTDSYLFGPARGEDSGGPANPRRGQKEKLTREKIAAMSYEEAEQRKPEIQAFFREQAGQ
jgi:hypothetical protein